MTVNIIFNMIPDMLAHCPALPDCASVGIVVAALIIVCEVFK